jgi:RNA polymerase sigma-70 factor (ECF subfamily)
MDVTHGTAEADSAAFVKDTEPFRRELLAHCYRMLGSPHDAEDLVQETYLRASRAYGDFEGRSSVRTWLYRIATNACLSALTHGSRRVLPSGLGAPEPDPGIPSVPAPAEVVWLQPVPDRLVSPEFDDPAAVVAGRQGLRLALIASLQYPPGQATSRTHPPRRAGVPGRRGRRHAGHQHDRSEKHAAACPRPARGAGSGGR